MNWLVKFENLLHRLIHFRGCEFEELSLAFISEPTQLIPFDLHNHLEDSVYMAVPKKRRTIEMRRIRRHLALKSFDFCTQNNLVNCQHCGHPHPRFSLCVNCYNHVREETSYLRSKLNGQLPSDHEIRFVYGNDQWNNSTSAFGVAVKGERPSWFPLMFKKQSPSDSNR